MTILMVLLVLGVALAALVRDIARDPARAIPCSHCDEFSPRWVDGGTGRWSV